MLEPPWSQHDIGGRLATGTALTRKGFRQSHTRRNGASPKGRSRHEFTSCQHRDPIFPGRGKALGTFE
jgi:hypothetical protein